MYWELLTSESPQQSLQNLTDFFMEKVQNLFPVIGLVTHEVPSIVKCFCRYPKPYFSNLVSENPIFTKCCPKSTGYKTELVFILIHGWGHNESALDDYRKEIEKQNYGPVYCPRYHSLKGVEAGASSIVNFIQSISKDFPSLKLVLIGHSMGGIIASKVAQDSGSTLAKLDIKIESVVTLGSPYHGTITAHLMGSYSSDLTPTSPTLKRIRTKIKEEPKTRYFHIGGGVDFILLSQDSAFPHENCDRMSFKHLGHAGLLCSQEVVVAVMKKVISISTSGCVESQPPELK